MEIQLMTCENLEELNFALNASWCGCAVMAIYKSVTYSLYCDISDEIGNGDHAAIMALIPDYMQRPTIEPNKSLIQVSVSKEVQYLFTW